MGQYPCARTAPQLAPMCTTLNVSPRGNVQQLRQRLQRRIATEPNPGAALPPAVRTAAAGVAPAAPVAPDRTLLARIVTAFIALQVVADLAGIIAILLPLDEVPTIYAATFALGFTIFADVLLIAGLTLGVMARMEETPRRTTIWATVMACAFAGLGIVLLWVDMGLSDTAILLPVGILLVVITIADFVSSWLVITDGNN
ncbi:MAG: hypothetical protein A2776_00845 [Candidatus Levybacteria bacterium RIFCSPHIGHO2_01_FULL_40_10]|nr:MAG: hypothetical protein A2776_00845 [Candidatus Levybacteria bacterium RIFCSPHIGHO2_01_FULL_40_10]